METNETPQSRPDESKLELNRESLLALHETGGWANFIAIMGFIMVGFLILVGLFMGTVLSSFTPEDKPLPFPAQTFTIIYLAIALVYFFPIYYLYNFANQVRNGIRSRDPDKIASGIRNLKSHYKFIGILTIVTICIYILAMVLMMALGAGAMLGDSVNA